ncbi:hypothetical protein BDD12DRAFT_823646 [Trichophaea hybrida]|nr:hypothetical protein BDD12DRAFT_823646 [Trichophaea hybrida]
MSLIMDALWVAIAATATIVKSSFDRDTTAIVWAHVAHVCLSKLILLSGIYVHFFLIQRKLKSTCILQMRRQSIEVSPNHHQPEQGA